MKRAGALPKSWGGISKLPKPLTPAKEAKRIKRLGVVHLSAAPKQVVVVNPRIEVRK